MVYLSDNKKFSISYRKLRDEYTRFTSMGDEEFVANIKDAIHLACVICFFKEIRTEHCLNDTGIIHELVHILCETDPVDIKEVRTLFAEQLKLI